MNPTPKQPGQNRTCGGGFASDELILTIYWSGCWEGGSNRVSHHRARGFRTFLENRQSRSL